ncbi:MAG TPA: MFS transporter [Elainellaceae cyanobacterium]
MNLKEKFDLPVTFWIVALIAFINSVGFTIVIPTLYPYAKEFGLSDFQASLLTTSYAISQFIGTPILGKLSDRLGRKPLLIISLLGTVAANLVASWTPVAWLLFAARVVDGLTGGNTSIAKAVISDTTHPQRRSKAFGVFSATFRLGFVAGPALSYFAQQLPPFPGVSSLGMSFFVASVIAAIAMLLTLFLLPETLKQEEEFQLSWRDFGFGKIAKSATRPKVGRIFVLTFFSGFTFTLFTFAFQPFFLNVLNQDAQTLAVIFAMIGIIGFVTQVFAMDPLTERFNVVNILSTALLGRGILFLLIPAFPNPTAFFIILAVFGVVNSYPLPLTNSILSLSSSEREQGEVLGINTSYLSISNAIGPATSGLLVTLGYGIPFWVAGGLTILTAWFAMTLKSRLDLEGEQA